MHIHVPYSHSVSLCYALSLGNTLDNAHRPLSGARTYILVTQPTYDLMKSGHSWLLLFDVDCIINGCMPKCQSSSSPSFLLLLTHFLQTLGQSCFRGAWQWTTYQLAHNGPPMAHLPWHKNIHKSFHSLKDCKHNPVHHPFGLCGKGNNSFTYGP